MVENLMKERKRARKVKGRLPTPLSSTDSTVPVDGSLTVTPTPVSEESLEMLWDSTFRMLRWESSEAGVLAMQRRMEQVKRRQEGHDDEYLSDSTA